MIKKVFLIRNVAPEMYGGGETYQIKLAQLLRRNNVEPFIISSSRELLRVAKKDGIKTIRAPYIKRQNWSGWRNILLPFYCMKIIYLKRWYRKIFDEYKPEIINIQSKDDWVAATGVAKKMGIKVLWTDHMDFRSWVLQNVNVWYKNLIGKWVLINTKKVDKIIMISDYEESFFDNLLGYNRLENTIVIKNGVNDEMDCYKGIKVEDKSFCYIGRIVDYKGIKELVEAFIKVAERYPSARLNIYGSGEINKYRSLCNGFRNIGFYGQTEEPLKVLAENDIFILPSYREGLSLSLLDAAMMGKKIIASDVDGNPEVVIDGKTGLLVPAKNAQRLAEAMIWMLENKKEATEMAKNARQFYEKNFDFEKIFKEKMLPLYNKEKEKK